jgi:hypothetical protein
MDCYQCHVLRGINYCICKEIKIQYHFNPYNVIKNNISNNNIQQYSNINYNSNNNLNNNSTNNSNKVKYCIDCGNKHSGKNTSCFKCSNKSVEGFLQFCKICERAFKHPVKIDGCRDECMFKIENKKKNMTINLQFNL